MRKERLDLESHVKQEQSVFLRPDVNNYIVLQKKLKKEKEKS